MSEKIKLHALSVLHQKLGSILDKLNCYKEKLILQYVMTSSYDFMNIRAAEPPVRCCVSHLTRTAGATNVDCLYNFQVNQST